METKQSQTSVSVEDYQSILESLGYILIDFGDHWRTKALYREGDNTTAVKIYKNTGVWMDFVDNRGCKPFEALVKLTTNDQSMFSDILERIKKEGPVNHVKVDKIQMEKTYSEDVLNKLFPNYKFYSDKGISEETQKCYRVGLAGVGKMYRRMVFPIYNEYKQIIGFSGRKIDDNNDYPKWKHIGKKTTWVYPAHVEGNECDSEIETTSQVILVESIGDAMALYDQGVKNVLVLFGLSASPSIINYLSSKVLSDIFISTNNDSNSKENRGLIAAIKNYLKLSLHFDLNALTIKLPEKGNDFGECYQNGYNINNWLNKQLNQEDQRKFISEFVSKNNYSFTKTEIKTASKING